VRLYRSGGNGDTFGGFLLFMYLVDGLPDAGLRVFPAPCRMLRNAFHFKRMDLAAAAAGMFPCHHFADGKAVPSPVAAVHPRH